MKFWKWLYPGIGFKRWVLLVLLGLVCLSLGLSLLLRFNIVNYLASIIYKILFSLNGHISGILTFVFAIIILILGIIVIWIALARIIARISKEFSPNDKLVDVLYKKKVLEKGPNIVAVGGGTGLSNLLRGIKIHTSNITAIVTVADDGGSSGKLRDELGILPPGDIRNCLVALADTEPLMEKLFQYRFSDEGHLVGHSFGNLFIASLTEVLGDFEEAIKESSKVLAIKGQVLPATNEDVRLGAVYFDKSIRMGESEIPNGGKKIDKVFLEPSDCRANQASIQAIREADVIVVGPGSLYTSILPNLLVSEIQEAIRESSAVKIYICNVMTQPGETSGYTVGDHLQAITDNVGGGFFDYIIVNKEEGSESLARRYEEEGAYPVNLDKEVLNKMDINIIEADLLTSQGYIRHDPHKLAEVILTTAEGRC